MSPKCDFCGSEFESEQKLIEHLRESHRDKVKLEKFENPRKNSA